MTFNPQWFSHPGATLSAILKTRSLSVDEFAGEADLTVETLRALVDGRCRIDEQIADKLAGAAGSTSGFWLRRQSDYESDVRRCAGGVSIEQGRAFLKSLPLKDMKQRGWLMPQMADLEAVLQFFDVPNVDSWNAQYASVSKSIAFRQSATFESDPASVIVWLREAERRAGLIACGAWSKQAFCRSLEEIRPLTRKKDPSIFFPRLVEICAAAGVAVVFVQATKGARVSGATKFSGPERAMIALSFRYLSDDHFWFTFFHEAAHLILHDRRAIFIEDGSETTQHEESEANAFASETLLPARYHADIKSSRLSTKRLIRLARDLGISPGTLVGQLQHAGVLGFNQFNGLKRRFNWQQLDVAL